MTDIEVERDVAVPMRDGVLLRADIYRPVGQGPWPVLLHRVPYNKTSPAKDFLIDSLDATRRGYIVVHQDTRGRFASDGEWLPWAHESLDGYDTVEWAARIPGSNGVVGMFGASYSGNTQWSAAVAQPPSLRAITPVTTWADPEDGLMFRGGATELGLNSAWALETGLGQVPKSGLSPSAMMSTLVEGVEAYDHMPDRTYWELPSGAQPSIVATGQPDIGVARALDDPDTLAESRVTGNHHKVNVPSLHVSGWYDVFLQGPIDSYITMKAAGIPAHLVIGPWNHTTVVVPLSGGTTGEVNFGLGAIAPPGNFSLSGLNLNWFDHWLRDTPATDLHASGVDVFVMGVNQWRREETWPLSRRVDTPLYLREGGVASLDAPHEDTAVAEYVYDPSDPVLTRGGALVMSKDYIGGPFDQRAVEERPDVLVFTTPPLEEDLEVTGRVSARLFVTSDAPSTDWVVRVCDVDERGLSLNIADGIRRSDLTPGEVTEVEVDLWSTSMVFRAGHRIRIQITSSNFPRWDRHFNTSERVAQATGGKPAKQAIHFDSTRPSAVILPIIPDEAKP